MEIDCKVETESQKIALLFPSNQNFVKLNINYYC